MLKSTCIHTAAGCLLAEEAGALVTDIDGDPWTLATEDFIIASTTAIHDKLIDIVKQSR